MAKKFTATDFLLRWLLALPLVFGTYNPSGYSYIGWLTGAEFQFGPLPALAGIALLIGWIIFLRASFLSLGWLGLILAGALFATIVWFFVDLGWLHVDSPSAIAWVILVLLSLVLAVGMSWGHIRRQLSGQVSVDDVED